jgi:plastocyanin
MNEMHAQRTKRRLALGGTILTAALAVFSLAQAADPTTVKLTIKDNKFMPSEIHVPAGIPVTLVIHNQDATAEEIDSDDLKIEKIIAGGKEVSVSVRPLAPGTYNFSGEYHSDTAKGQLIVD